MEYDLVVQLGSQVKYTGADYELAPHTVMRTQASEIVLKKGIAKRLIVAGGSNFGVRYDDEKILSPANLSFEALANADFFRKSESWVIKWFLVNRYGIDPAMILPETMSSTTQENAEFLKIILRRRPAFTGNEKIAILTLLYHMEKAWPVFQNAQFAKEGIRIEPLFAENVLADSDPEWIERICQYYSVPRGGKQYPTDKIRRLLTNGNSLAGLMSD